MISPAEKRTLKIIDQNIVLSTHVRDDDVIDTTTGKRVIPSETLEQFQERGWARWEEDEEYQEFRLRLTEQGRALLQETESSEGTK